MTTYDDPNREAVGLDPIWTGADEEPAGAPEAEPFDPGDHTVADVEAHVEANPDQRQAVLDAERAGKNRTTLIEWLENP